MLAGGRGVPLVVTWANRHDVTQLQAVLDGCEVQDMRKASDPRHLRADAAYTGAPAQRIIEDHGYISHVKGRGQKAGKLKGEPGKRTRRWIVEVAQVGSTAFASCWCAMKSFSPLLSRSTIWPPPSLPSEKYL